MVQWNEKKNKMSSGVGMQMQYIRLKVTGKNRPTNIHIATFMKQPLHTGQTEDPNTKNSARIQP